MSVTKYFKNKWPDLVASFLISFIPLSLVYFLGIRHDSKKELELKIDKKADVEYVKESIKHIEDREENIKQDIVDLKQADKDTRIEFIQELRLLRKDINELYKNK